MSQLVQTSRTRLKRQPQRGSYERALIHAILDEALIAHVAFSHAGHASVIPIVHARIGDHLYLHGSTANRALRAIADGGEVCVTAMLIDALVLARSAFHHSVNYRSVVLYAHGSEVSDREEKLAALRATVEHVTPGRWSDVRGPDEKEFARTLVVRLPIEEASAKVRDLPPVDDDEDYRLGCWAGLIPVRTDFGAPIADPKLAPGIEPPTYVTRYARPVR
jgi:nitroimidazol reductase NimA-like FMN-containing flavoprotein (pyridoxamine 5'-phosphate oxidase superfamily)